MAAGAFDPKPDIWQEFDFHVRTGHGMQGSIAVHLSRTKKEIKTGKELRTVAELNAWIEGVKYGREHPAQ